MLAINSPEFSYADHHIFEANNGELLRFMQTSTGAERLYRVDAETGKQTPIAKAVFKEQEQTRTAQQLVDKHTHAIDSGTGHGTYSSMDWESALQEIFTQPKPAEVSRDETVAEQDSVISPYITVMSPNSDPASIEHSVAELDGRGQTIVITGISQPVQSTAVARDRVEPQVQHEGLTPSGVVDPSTLTVLGMAAVIRGGKGGSRLVPEWMRNRYNSYFHTNDPNRNDRRRAGTIVVSALAALALIIGVGYCANQDDDGRNAKATASASPTPTPTPSATSSTEKPGPDTKKPPVNDNGSGKDSKGNQEPTSIKFMVEEGNGITHELVELAEGQGIELSGAEAFQQYLDLETYSKKTDTPFFSGNNAGTYTMHDGHYGISEAGWHHWNQEMQKQALKWLDDNEDEISQ